MKGKTLYKITNITPYKWGAYILLFVFIFSSMAVYYNNVRTYSKQQVYDTGEEDLPMYEELAEEAGISVDNSFPSFIFTKIFSIKNPIFSLLIFALTQYQISYIQNIPLFIMNRVLRL